MFVGRIDEIQLVRSMLASAQGTGEAIISFHGLFGAGKTTLLRRVRTLVESEGLVDAVMATNEDITVSTLPEFVFALASGFQSFDRGVVRLVLDEIEARRRRYLQIAGQLGADAMPLLQSVRAESGGGGGYGERRVEAEALALEVAIKNQFNNRDDQRLTLDTANVVTEALLVDLMTTFFPLDTGAPPLEEQLRARGPRRLLVMIDTYEKITALVNPWLLESFLPYVLHKRFGDFQSYRTKHLPDHIHVREAFDVRLIVAGRERLSLTDQERRWDRHRDSMREHRLGPFSREELGEFLVSSGFDPSEHLDEVLELTQGLPYLASLWVDAATAEAAGAERAFLNALAEQRIFWYKTPEQREWIRSAAFLDWFDADALRCFEAVGEDASRAFEYLRNSSEVARPSRSRPGKFELHEIIRRALRDATFQQSSERAESYRESAEAFYGASELLARFGAEHRALVRRLAYFSLFDESAIERFFGGEAHKVHDLIEEAPDLFSVDADAWRMETDARRRLARYNRYADGAVYRQTTESLHTLWEARARELRGEIEDRRSELAATRQRVRSLLSEGHMKVELQQSAHSSVRVLETELARARRRWYQRLSPRESLVARTSFFLLAVSVLMIFGADALPIDDRTRDLVRTAALAMSALFLLVFSLLVGRMLYMKSRRQEHAVLREDVASIEGRLSSKQYEFHGLSSEAEQAREEAVALEARCVALEGEIAALESKLARPYV
ncbi:MAG TPA: hypothetical protein VNA88_13405 [Candidatus Kapabacteria bacterium]|jgi:hypothetical protein|nr:hypothetical protein [Candidatus Kapabacteria bacterium]